MKPATKTATALAAGGGIAALACLYVRHQRRLAVAAAAAASAADPNRKFRKDYAPCAYTVSHVSLVFELEKAEARSEVTAVLTLAPSVAGTPDLRLDAESACGTPVLVGVWVDGKELRADVDYVLDPSQDSLVVRRSALGDRPMGVVRSASPPLPPFPLSPLPSADPLPPPPPLQDFELTTKCAHDPKANLSLQGLYQSSGVFCTQCEANSFRQICPFLDRPDVMTTYTCRIEADKAACPVLLGNGNKVASGDLPGGHGTLRYSRTRGKNRPTSSGWWPATSSRCGPPSPP